jgi:hypothetical protein
MEIGQLILIRWIDPYNKGGWIDEDELEKIVRTNLECNTVGWIVREEEDSLYVASSYFEGGDQIGEVFKIPREVIRSIKLLNIGRTRRKR